MALTSLRWIVLGRENTKMKPKAIIFTLVSPEIIDTNSDLHIGTHFLKHGRHSFHNEEFGNKNDPIFLFSSQIFSWQLTFSPSKIMYVH